MKYMGSKRLLLLNGLGDLVLREASRSARFVDLFSGTGAVATHVAERVDVPVVAVDLQRYAAVLAAAVIDRTSALEYGPIEDAWLRPAKRRLRRLRLLETVVTPDPLTVRHVRSLRRTIPELPSSGTIWRAYAGYYFSPEQALAFDCMIRTLPEDPALRTVGLAAVVQAAMKCAASPGHTAQPFQPTASSISHIASAWKKDPVAIVEEVLRETIARHALQQGCAIVGDANVVAERLTSDDLAFVDPPYSSAQYSRYYHVLETVARGSCGQVEGAGRYPPMAERPSSLFSRTARAADALLSLLDVLADRGCRTILTFPQHAGSNGIVGHELVDRCRTRFEIDVRSVSTRFSTLGGNNLIRASRRRSAELVLYMKPRRGSSCNKLVEVATSTA